MYMCTCACTPAAVRPSQSKGLSLCGAQAGAPRRWRPAASSQPAWQRMAVVLNQGKDVLKYGHRLVPQNTEPRHRFSKQISACDSFGTCKVPPLFYPGVGVYVSCYELYDPPHAKARTRRLRGLTESSVQKTKEHLVGPHAGAAQGARLCYNELVSSDAKLKNTSTLVQAFAVSSPCRRIQMSASVAL